MMSRRKNMHAAPITHHRVKHQPIPRRARYGLDRLARKRARRERRRAPGDAQLGVGGVGPRCRGARGARHLLCVALKVVVHVQGEDRVGEAEAGGGTFVLKLPVDHATEEEEETCRVWSRGVRNGCLNGGGGWVEWLDETVTDLLWMASLWGDDISPSSEETRHLL